MKDYQTRNRSFLEMAETLKKAGIRNNDFFLELLDEGLQGIDPYDKNISDDIKQRILVEAKNNIWYYVREIVMIPRYGGCTPFKLNRMVLAKSWCYTNECNSFTQTYKQSGKTTTDLVLISHGFFEKFNGLKILNVEGYLFKDIYNDIISLMPDYFSKDNICPHTATIGPKQGSTNLIGTSIVLFDDVTTDKLFFERFRNIKHKVMYLKNVCGRSSFSPISSMNSTRSFVDDENIINKITDFINDCVQFVDTFYDEEISCVRKRLLSSKRGCFIIKYTYDELGKDSKWYNQLESISEDKNKFRSEIF